MRCLRTCVDRPWHGHRCWPLLRFESQTRKSLHLSRKKKERYRLKVGIHQRLTKYTYSVWRVASRPLDCRPVRNQNLHDVVNGNRARTIIIRRTTSAAKKTLDIPLMENLALAICSHRPSRLKCVLIADEYPKP